MKRKSLLILLFALTLLQLIASNCYSQEKTVIPEAKFKLLSELMEVNGTKNVLQQKIDAIIASAPIENKEQLKKMLNIDGIIEVLLPIYNKYFHIDELQDLVKFYKSPTGKKLVEVSPQLSNEAMNAAIGYFKEKIPQ